MSKPASTHVAKGYATITPYLIVPDAGRLIDFLIGVFHASEVMLMRTPEGKVGHACFRIADSHVELADSNAQWPVATAALHIYVPDVDATYQAALKAGAESLFEPRDMFYGERSAGVKDPTGNQWFISTLKEELSLEEIEQRAAEQGKSICG